MDAKFTPVKETIELLEFGLSLQEALTDSLEDGKVTVLEIPNFLNTALKLRSGLNGLNEIPNEIDTPEEQSLVVEYFKQRFDLTDEIAELLIEDTVNWLLSTYSLGQRWAKFIKK